MQQFFDSLVQLLTMSPVVYLGGVVYTASAFNWMRTMIKEYKAHSEWFYISVILLNGLLLTVLSVQGNSFMASINPAIFVMSVPVLVVLEFSVISRDKLQTFIFLVCLLMLQIACTFGIAATFITSVADDLYISDNKTRAAVLTLTMILLSLSLVLFRFFTKSQVKILRHIIHDKSLSSMLFIYMFLNGTVLGVTTGFDYNVYFTYGNMNPLRTSTLAGMILRYLLIMTTSLILIQAQCRMEMKKEEAEALSEDLAMEKKRREITQKHNMFSFSVNITQNTIIEGDELFSEKLWQGTNGSYRKMLKNLMEFIVHPDYFQSFMQNTSINRESSLHDFTLKFKYSPAKILEVLNFTDKLKERLGALQKEWAWGEIEFTYVKDDSTKDVIAYADIKDIDAREEERTNLETAAMTDDLTGLYNRAAAVKLVTKIISESDVDNDEVGTFFILDMDCFKEINDNLGHPVGDSLLKKIAKILRSVFRDNDVICRLGGDEFCVFMTACGDEIVKIKANLLNEKLRLKYKKHSGEEINVSASIGISFCRKHGNDYDTLYREADKALYEAKEKGKDRYSFAN